MIRTLPGGAAQKQATLETRELSSSAKAAKKKTGGLVALNALFDNQLVFMALGAIEHMSGRD